MFKKMMSLILVIAMIFTLACPAMATSSQTQDDALDVSAAGVNITQNGSYTVTGTTTDANNNIKVADNVEATITLNNVSITLSDGSGVDGGGSSDMSGAGTAAIALGAGSKVILILVGENTLQSGKGRAAIEVPGSKIHVDGAPTAATPAALTIEGSGSLTAKGGDAAAGIGGSFCMNAGSITINSGNITAAPVNGYSGAGIGGCHAGDRVDKAYGSFDSITINGGTITADGVTLGAGIGAGAHGDCANATITINGGVITANGGTYRADPGDDIGLAHGGSSKTPPAITIGGDAVVIADSINEKNSSAGAGKTTINGGIVIDGTAGAVYGDDTDVTLKGNLTIAPNVTLTLPAGMTLTVPSGVSLTVNGAIAGEGTVLVKGGEVVGEDHIRCTYVPGDYILTLTAEPASQTYNQQVVLTATLTKYADGSVATDITGDVTFTCGENTLGTVALANGVATLTTTADWAAGDYTVKAAVIVSEIPCSGKTTVTVVKAEQTTAPAAPTAAEGGISYGTITLSAVTDEGQGNVEYAYVEKPAEGDAEAPSNWQTSTELTSLKAGTTYIVYSRFSGNEYYLPSAASTGTEITTAAMAAMTAPVLSTEGNTVTYKAVTLTAPAASEVYAEAIVQYRKGTAGETEGEVEWGEWQDSAEFTGLTSETTYQFQARYAIKAYEHYSEASEAIMLTTLVTPKYNVTFRMIGASKPSGTPSFRSTSYDYMGAEYQNWVKTKAYVVDADTTAEELAAKVMDENGIVYDMDILSGKITSPEAFGPVHDLHYTAYGSYSCWCITVYRNGELVEEVCPYWKDYELQDGDQIIFHYTFNYYYETKGGRYSTRHPGVVQKYLQVMDLLPEEIPAVESTIGAIAAIGRVTPDSKAAIEAARAAYDALNDGQKAYISNYETLTAAEAAYAAIEANADNRTALPTPVVSVKEGSAGLYGITLNEGTIEGAEDADYTIYYSASTDGTNWGAWQTSTAFDKLLPAETYYFRAMAQTADWTKYGDSEASEAVTGATLGGDVAAVQVDTAAELSVALTQAATDGTLSKIDITADIVVNDITGEFWTAELPQNANVLLTSSNGSRFLLNEPGGNSFIGITAGSTITVRNLELGAISGYGVLTSLMPSNEWQNILRTRDSSAVINLDGVTMYSENGSGAIGDTFGATINIYSGGINAILGNKLMGLNKNTTVNLIPNGDIMVEGTLANVSTVNVIPMLRKPVSGTATTNLQEYTPLGVLEGTMSYGKGLRVNTDSTTTVPPVALTAPVAVAADAEGADAADLTYVVEDNKITFTLKNANAKEADAIFQMQRSGSGYMRAFTNDADGIGVTYEFGGLTKDTEYTFTLRYNSLDSGYTNGESTVAITTTFTPQVLAAPDLGDQAEKTENSITLTAPDASTEDTTAVVQYRISTDGENWGEWQDSTTFENLTASTTYYFQARYKAVHKYWLDSEASAAVQIATKAPTLAAPEVSAEGASATAFTITLPAPAASAEDAAAIVQYRISEDGQTWGDWQEDAKFTGLKAETTYYFQIRYVSSSNAWLDSAASETITVTTVSDANAPVFAVENVSARAGEQVKVKVQLKNNPGIISAVLNVSYDQSKLKLVGAEDAKLLPNGTFSNSYETYPFILSWEDSTAAENITANGTLAVLTFEVGADCVIGDMAAVTLSFDPSNVYDKNMNNVALDVVNGTVTVVDHKWGAPTYEWSADYSTCTATRVCQDEDCVDLVETETVNSTCERTEATETENGQAVYTAVFANAAFETQSFTEILYAIKAEFVISQVSGCIGGEVEVTISMNENPGIIAAALNVDYDSDKLELVGVKDTGLLKGFVSGDDLAEDPFYLSWVDSTAAENNAANGTIATLTFKVKEGCAVGDVAAVTLTYKDSEIHDTALNNVAFRVVAGSVAIADHVWGEVTYTWSKDHSACTAEQSCACGESRFERADAVTQTTEPSCSEEGETVYTVVFANSAFETQTYTEVLPTLDHDYLVSGGDEAALIYTCQACGDVVEGVVDEGTAVLTVSHVSGSIGEELEVTVSVKNNPGFISALFEVGYDETVLELTGAENVTALKTFAVNGNVITLGGINETANETDEGAIVVLSFKVLSGCEEGTAVTLTYDPDNMRDYEMDGVVFAIDNGMIIAGDYILGDVNDDGSVNIKDVTILRRYLANWTDYQNIVKMAADVNVDNEINIKDVTILRRYLAGWEGVTLG